MDDGDPAPAQAAAKILAYLRERPNAADSLDGVAQWWLPQQHGLYARQAVRDALDLLVAHGLLERTANPDGTTIYRASAAFRDAAQPGRRGDA